MNLRIWIALMAISLAACNNQKKENAEQGDHDHTEATTEHEEPKFQYTAYSNDFELFAEADPFIIGETSKV